MISIIIVNYNVKDYLVQCIDSIAKSNNKIPYEIIVVDNNSTDNLSDLSATYPKLKLHKLKKNYGYAYAVNYGVKKSLYDNILLLNPDTLIKEDTLDVLLDTLSRDSVGIAGCKVLNPDGSFQLASRRSFPYFFVAFFSLFKLDKLFSRIKIFSKYNYTYISEDTIQEVDAVSGACMMFEKTIFNKIGNFDESYFMYFEDTDFCFRAKRMGYKVVYNPATQIIHYKGESVKRSNKNVNMHFYDSMYNFFSKHKDEYINWNILRYLLKVGISFQKIFLYLKKNKEKIIAFFFDLISLAVGYSLAMFIWYKYVILQPLSSDYDLSYSKYYMSFLIILISWLASSLITSIYKFNFLSYSKGFTNTICAFFMSSSLTYFISIYAHSRGVLLLTFLISGFMISSWRIMLYIGLNTFNINSPVFSKLVRKNSIIIGYNDYSKAVGTYLINKKDANYNFLGYVSENDISYSNDEKYNIIGHTEDLLNIVDINNINQIILCTRNNSANNIFNIFNLLKYKNIQYKISPYGKNIIISKGRVDKLTDIPLLDINIPYMNRVNLFIKRLFDIILSFLLIVMTLPVQIVYFSISKIKQRTIIGLDSRKIILNKISNKSRYISNILILYNIFFGSISFVGSDFLDYENNYNKKLLIKPGLTSINNINKNFKKVDSELSYIQNYSLLYDLEILLKNILIK